ncbi:MAG: M48 family metalloprotease [Haloarculaceae archaeon]
MLPPAGALLSHLALATVCWSATRLVAVSAGPDPRVASRLRRGGAAVALLLAAGWGTLVGTAAHVSAWAAAAVPGLPADLYPTLGALVLFSVPVPLAAYAAYRGADATVRPGGATGQRSVGTPGSGGTGGNGTATPRTRVPAGSPRRFLGGYATAVGPAIGLTALAPALPDGGWLVAGVALVGGLLAAGSPLFVRRMVGSRPLTAAERAAIPTDVPVHVLLTGREGPANALAAGVLPGLRCVYVTERLLDSLPPREAAAIVTHEVGHHRRRHVPLRLGAVGAYVLPWLGATALSVPGAFLAGLVLLVPATLAIFRLVRWTEYDADAYAARRAGADALADALDRLGTRGLLGGTGGPLALHPPLAARVDRLVDVAHERVEAGPDGDGRYGTGPEAGRTRPEGRSGD